MFTLGCYSLSNSTSTLSNSERRYTGCEFKWSLCIGKSQTLRGYPRVYREHCFYGQYLTLRGFCSSVNH